MSFITSQECTHVQFVFVKYQPNSVMGYHPHFPFWIANAAPPKKEKERGFFRRFVLFTETRSLMSNGSYGRIKYKRPCDPVLQGPEFAWKNDTASVRQPDGTKSWHKSTCFCIIWMKHFVLGGIFYCKVFSFFRFGDRKCRFRDIAILTYERSRLCPI